MHRWTLTIVTVMAAAALVIYAAAWATPEAATAGSCLRVPAGMVTSLKSSLKRNARGKLSAARGIKSSQRVTIPRGFRAGVYFVSARIRGFGTATWAADASAFRTGGGFIVGIGPVARRVSNAGIDISPSVVRGWGLSERTDGYAASRACVRRA